jgi:hypothetical protein
MNLTAAFDSKCNDERNPPNVSLSKKNSLWYWSAIVMPCSEFIELEWSSKEYAKRRHMVAQPLPEGRREFTGTRRVGQFRTAYPIQFHRKNCDVCQND